MDSMQSAPVRPIESIDRFQKMVEHLAVTREMLEIFKAECLAGLEKDMKQRSLMALLVHVEGPLDRIHEALNTTPLCPKTLMHHDNKLMEGLRIYFGDLARDPRSGRRAEFIAMRSHYEKWYPKLATRIVRFGACLRQFERITANPSLALDS